MHADFIRPSTSPILRNLRFALLLPLSALIACGSSPSNSSSGTSTSTATPYNFNGTWSTIATTSYAFDLPFSSIGGPLQVSNGMVTGTLTPYSSYGYGGLFPNVCAAVNTPVPVTGTLDADNDLALTFLVAGGTGTLLATLADNPATVAHGSLQIVGGTCPMILNEVVVKQLTATTPATTTPSPTTGTLSGNWGINSVSLGFNRTDNLVFYGFGGALQFSNGSVAGNLAPIWGGTGSTVGVACELGNNGASPAFTGILDASNNLTLTGQIAGGTATITAVLSGNPQTLAAGSYQVVGGPCAMTATPMTIAQYAPITGTYKGTLYEGWGAYGTLPSNSVTVTEVLAQSTTANANSQFPITGTVSIVGGPCAGTLSFTRPTSGGNFIDNSVWVGDSTNPNASIINAWNGVPYCTDLIQGTLTRQ
jgi:hypothetical protein